MQATNSNIASPLNTSSAVGLIGRTVSYVDADGDAADRQGRARRHHQGRQATLTVAGKAGIDPSSISEVSASSGDLKQNPRSTPSHDARHVRRDQRSQAAPGHARCHRE